MINSKLRYLSQSKKYKPFKIISIKRNLNLISEKTDNLHFQNK